MPERILTHHQNGCHPMAKQSRPDDYSPCTPDTIRRAKAHAALERATVEREIRDAHRLRVQQTMASAVECFGPVAVQDWLADVIEKMQARRH